ncbi:hypothetical protein KEJ47_00690 [Candidatus Bathyarchaeota archaeon]|nr:hypothetical protein [Candidatus Bathyarchaeota archaeon]
MGSLTDIETLNVNLPLDVPMPIFDEMLRILKVISNPDGLAIFLYTKNGLPSANKIIRDLGLTKKRYYSRLKELIDVGLIEKSSGVYQYTLLGEAVSKLGIALGQILENKDRLRLIDEINKNKALSAFEIDQIREVIIQQSSTLQSALNLILDSKSLKKIEVFSNYEVGINILINNINSSKERVFLASKYFDTRVIESTIKAYKRGVDFRVIMASENLTKKIEMLKLLLSPKLIMELMEFANNGANKSVREYNINYSYCIIDNNACFFEFPPFEDKFTIGFFVIDAKINQQFSELFLYQWEEAEAKEMPNFFKKLSKLNI